MAHAAITGIAPSYGKDPERPALLESSALNHGAQLYDNWSKLKGETPQGSHPLYPAEGKKHGKSSWRCKECHGWDYIGKDGRYSKGSHFTGFEGVLGSSGKPPAELYEKLAASEKSHDFSTSLKRQELEALSVFLSRGLINTAQYLDSDGNALGDAQAGSKLYGSHCASCHGNDGNSLDFKPKKQGVQGVGWLAVDNPQESLHKIRWGHPGSDMPSMVVDEELTVKDAVDILAYCQALN
jgi:thiosulfate dehydrogenase